MCISVLPPSDTGHPTSLSHADMEDTYVTHAHMHTCTHAHTTHAYAATDDAMHIHAGNATLTCSCGCDIMRPCAWWHTSHMHTRTHVYTQPRMRPCISRMNATARGLGSCHTSFTYACYAFMLNRMPHAHAHPELLFSYGLLAALFPSRSLPGLTLQHAASTQHTHHTSVTPHLHYPYNKLPSHLAIALVSSHVHAAYIAHLITWIMACGITRVTLYDAEGMCQSVAMEIATAIYAIQQKTRQHDASGTPNAAIMIHTHATAPSSVSTPTPASAASASLSHDKLTRSSTYLDGYQHGYTHGYWNGLTTAIVHGMSAQDKNMRRRKEQRLATTQSHVPAPPHTIRITASGVTSVTPSHMDEHDIHIHLLSQRDGQQAICDAVQRIATREEDAHGNMKAALRKELHRESWMHMQVCMLACLHVIISYALCVCMSAALPLLC